jgi:hypothetical protein
MPINREITLQIKLTKNKKFNLLSLPIPDSMDFEDRYQLSYMKL